MEPDKAEKKILSDARKVLGNEAMKAHRFEQAIKFYTEAIELFSESPILWSNRSQAHLKMEEYALAVDDANESIKVDPDYFKGYYRRGSAFMGLSKYSDALEDFKHIQKIFPNDVENEKKIQECERLIDEAAGDAEAESDRQAHHHHVDASQILIGEGYDGPHIGAYGVTLEFVKQLMIYQKNQKILHKRYATQIIETAESIFSSQPSLIDIDIPKSGRFTVCGDIHGQYYDLLNIFELNGLPSEENPYLFNGDFVDRGSFSVEVILLLLAFKVLYPKHFFMARGNHESRNLNRMYGFEGEVKHKYDQETFDLFLQVFCQLPLAHVLNKKVFVVHGGLCKNDGITLDQIRSVDRNREPPDQGIMCDLLWSDPSPYNGRMMSKRGVGVQFGPDVTKRFLELNNLELIVRSHEVKFNGYEVEADGRLVTVFSAPNYCDQMGNKGAYIIFDHDCVPVYRTFDAVPHPYVPPLRFASMFGLFGM